MKFYSKFVKISRVGQKFSHFWPQFFFLGGGEGGGVKAKDFFRVGERVQAQHIPHPPGIMYVSHNLVEHNCNSMIFDTIFSLLYEFYNFYCICSLAHDFCTSFLCPNKAVENFKIFKPTIKFKYLAAFLVHKTKLYFSKFVMQS